MHFRLESAREGKHVEGDIIKVRLNFFSSAFSRQYLCGLAFASVRVFWCKGEAVTLTLEWNSLFE